MKTNKVKALMLGLSLVAMLLVGMGSTSTADAQNRRIRRPHRVIVYRHFSPFWYRHYDPFYDPFYASRFRVVDPIAYQKEQGFREGKDEGEEDAEKGRIANATGHKDYVKSDSIHFRQAFVQGYNDGYREEVAEIREKNRKKAEKLREKHGG
jgi:hypothetical protein